VKNIQKTEMRVRLWSAMLLYPLLALGQAYFILPEAREKDSVVEAVQRAFILGLIVYGATEAVNHAIFTNWTLQVSSVDMIAGIILTVLVSIITFEIHHHIKGKLR
jgi:uncharacterized membrane protein